LTSAAGITILSRMRLPNLLATKRGRLVAFFFLYVTEGIPLGFAATAIATQMRRQRVGVADIGAMVAATQFTAYMTLTNFAIQYSARWQGLALERWGYPTTLMIDAFGLVSLMLLPFVSPSRQVAPAGSLDLSVVAESANP
jgi:hypothetical protein